MRSAYRLQCGGYEDALQLWWRLSLSWFWVTWTARLHPVQASNATRTSPWSQGIRQVAYLHRWLLQTYREKNGAASSWRTWITRHLGLFSTRWKVRWAWGLVHHCANRLDGTASVLSARRSSIHRNPTHRLRSSWTGCSYLCGTMENVTERQRPHGDMHRFSYNRWTSIWYFGSSRSWPIVHAYERGHPSSTACPHTWRHPTPPHQVPRRGPI